MRRALFTLIFLTLSKTAFCQQKPHYTQYFQSQAVLNPAVTGVTNEIDIKAGLRNQWAGLESAPKTSFLTVSSPRFGNSMAKYTDFGIVEPEFRTEKDDYESSYGHHAAGLVLLSDKTGALSRTVFNITYAYHIQINENFNLSVGIGAGLNQTALDPQKLRFKEEGDLAVGGEGSLQKIKPDLNAGVYFYGASFFAGAVVQQVLNQTLSFGDGYTAGKESPHFFLTGGYRIWLGEEISVTPSVMLKYISPLPSAYDLNLKAMHKNDLWLGVSLRQGDSLAAMFGFKVSRKASLGYAYEYTTSELRSTTSGSHEIVLGLNF